MVYKGDKLQWCYCKKHFPTHSNARRHAHTCKNAATTTMSNTPSPSCSSKSDEMPVYNNDKWTCPRCYKPFGYMRNVMIHMNTIKCKDKLANKKLSVNVHSVMKHSNQSFQ